MSAAAVDVFGFGFCSATANGAGTSRTVEVSHRRTRKRREEVGHRRHRMRLEFVQTVMLL
jgi:hypothetical protein